MRRPCLCPCPVPLSGPFPSSRPRLSPLEHGGAITSPAGLREREGALGDQPLSTRGGPALFPLPQDLDDMDADLLGLRKPHLASSRSAAKGSGREEPPSHPKPAGTFAASEKGERDPALRNLGGFGGVEMWKML